MKVTIIQLEDELRQAMIESNVEKLDELIDDSLVFVGPTGLVVSKAMDLEAHRSKIQKITKMTPSEQNIETKDDLAIVTVKMALEGSFLGNDISGNYRYLRVWRKTNGTFKIISGAVVGIPE